VASDLIIHRPEGLYCPQGDFYIDPWRRVDRAVLTHAHADHARWGMGQYIATRISTGLLQSRLGKVNLFGLEYGESIQINGVRVELIPAGHVLGSAQVRVEYRGQVWVASGDYKVEPDRTCAPFEPVRCHTFISESTFGLPVYRWQPQAEVFDQINDWWRSNQNLGKTSVLYCYSLGKAQRILAGVDGTIGPIVCHGAALPLNDAYRQAGIVLPEALSAAQYKEAALQGSHAANLPLVLAPPSVAGSAWLKSFAPLSDAFASGWMLLRGARRRRAIDRGFVLSDHADWPGLAQAIKASGAEQIILTHGYVPIMVRWLQEQGYQARSFATEFGVEDDSSLAVDQEKHVAAPPQVNSNGDLSL
jgi:putative mRNA 3-end processing factor